MPRRASSSANPVWILAIILIIFASLGGGYFVFKNVSDPYRTLTPLDTQAYLQNSNSLEGNVYKLNGTISNMLQWSASAGRLFSVEVEGTSGTDILPLLVPKQFDDVNIQKGQKFYFEVEVGDKGLLRAKGIKKA